MFNQNLWKTLVAGCRLEGPVTAWLAWKDGKMQGLRYTTLDSASLKHIMKPTVRERVSVDPSRWDELHDWFETMHRNYCGPHWDEKWLSTLRPMKLGVGGWLEIKAVGKLLQVYYESTWRKWRRVH